MTVGVWLAVNPGACIMANSINSLGGYAVKNRAVQLTFITTKPPRLDYRTTFVGLEELRAGVADLLLSTRF